MYLAFLDLTVEINFDKMLNTFMILKRKFNKTVAFRVLLHLYPAEIFIRGIKINRLWLCKSSYRPQYLSLKIGGLRLIEWAANNGYLEEMKWLYSKGVNPRAYNDSVIIWASGHLEVVK
jgi:hypothetical protein